MKITLIKPSLGNVIKGYNLNEGSMEPLQLAIIAGLVDDGDDVVMYDDRIEPIPFDEQTDLVLITVESFSARRAYQISKEFRQREIPVILGGMHVSLLPDEAMVYADAIVVGDVEPVWTELISDARNKSRDIFKDKKYLPVSLVQFSRGCKFNCSFCSVSRFFDHSHQCRKMEDVLYEIERDKLKTILFVDDNMVSNRKELKVFLIW